MDRTVLYQSIRDALHDELVEHGVDLAPLGGRSGPPGTIKAVQLFGSVATPTAVATNLVPFDRSEAPWIEMCDGPAEGLYSIHSVGREVQRVSADGLQPLTQQQILSGAQLPAGVNATVTDHTRIKLRIRLDTAMGTRVFDIDSGQPLDVYAQAVTVERLLPANFTEVAPDQENHPALPNRSGLVVDAILGARIMRVEEAIGHRTARLTQVANVAGEVQAAIVRPAGAISVVIYQTAAGTASPTWTQFYGQPGAGIAIATLPFIGTSRRTEQESLLPDCTHLQTDLDPSNARVFTLVWTIQP